MYNNKSILFAYSLYAFVTCRQTDKQTVERDTDSRLTFYFFRPPPGTSRLTSTSYIVGTVVQQYVYYTYIHSKYSILYGLRVVEVDVNFCQILERLHTSIKCTYTVFL